MRQFIETRLGHVHHTFIFPGDGSHFGYKGWRALVSRCVRKCSGWPPVWLHYSKVLCPDLYLLCLMLMCLRTASYKALTIGGAIISSTAYMLLVFFWRGKTNIWESLYIGPGGFGTGIVMATTFIGIAAGVEESKMAIASTGLYLSANVGCLVGASLASTILRTSLRNGLNQGLKGYANRESVSSSKAIQ